MAPSPPGHGNFEVPPVVHRDPYDYAVEAEDEEGNAVDFLVQTHPAPEAS